MPLRLSASPEELRRRFYSLRTAQDVADLLEIELERLYYHLYIVSESSRYTTFDIPKRTGGTRTISAPVTALKIIQQKLNQVLLHAHQPKPSTHSFLLGRSILTNARVHTGRRNILNVDLKDFFPSINFGRVRGLFMGTPYRLEPAAATVLAQICCFNNQLPQGAPTSPIVSNMICARMDSQLIRLARENRCDYTRYADDITFSTNLREFPSALVTINSVGQIEAGAELSRIITENGFQINPDKIRLRHRSRRQEVTGLITNRFPNVRRKYVRQVRAMLHAWEKFGLEAAQAEFRNVYDRKHRSPWKQAPSFKRVIKGKIEFLGMVRGKHDPIYLRFCEQLRTLAPELVKESQHVLVGSGAAAIKPLVMTEGKTDCKHLEAALLRLKELGHYPDFDIEFVEHERDMGDTELLTTCRVLSKRLQDKPTICVFDRDRPDIVRRVSAEGRAYKEWRNNVFSFAIPVPAHRTDTPHISIEFYYKASEITQEDKYGKRLFLSNEFDPDSCRHKDLNLSCPLRSKIHSPNISVIDCEVYNERHENVALSKTDFADYILNRVQNFDNFDFSEFRKIFDLIVMIVTGVEPPNVA